MYVCICKYEIFGLIIRKYIQICLVVPSRKQSFGGISQDFPCSISRAQTAPRKRHADAELQTKRRLASYGMLGYATLRSSVTDTPPIARICQPQNKVYFLSNSFKILRASSTCRNVSTTPFTLISKLATDYIQMRRGQALLSSSLLNMILTTTYRIGHFKKWHYC